MPYGPPPPPHCPAAGAATTYRDMLFMWALYHGPVSFFLSNVSSVSLSLFVLFLASLNRRRQCLLHIYHDKVVWNLPLFRVGVGPSVCLIYFRSNMPSVSLSCFFIVPPGSLSVSCFFFSRQSEPQTAMFNLLATIVGGGVLSLPYAFRCGRI